MVYYPIDAFMHPSVSRLDFAVELVQSMRARLPNIQLAQSTPDEFFQQLTPRLPGVSITCKLRPPDWISPPELRMTSDNDEVQVLLRRSDPLMIEFWDFAPEVYDADGPTLAMIQDKWETALQLMCALIERCGARLAYFSSSDSKYGGDWDALIDGIRAALDAPEQATQAFRRTPHYWMVALRREDEALH